MDQHVRVDDRGLTRRDLMRRGAVVGGSLVWAAPALQSFARPAFAQTDGSPVGLCPGFMTGGGKIEFVENRGVTYGLGKISCQGTFETRTTIEINWSVGDVAYQFHADRNGLSGVTCLETPADQEQPFACFDTITGTATGRLRIGSADPVAATLTFTLVDGGEGNDSTDNSTFVITSGSETVLSISGLVRGNLQAHSAHSADCTPCSET